MKREAFSLYVFVSIVAIDGHSWWIFKRAFTVERVECVVSINKQDSLRHCIMKDATH